MKKIFILYIIFTASISEMNAQVNQAYSGTYCYQKLVNLNQELAGCGIEEREEYLDLFIDSFRLHLRNIYFFTIDSFLDLLNQNSNFSNLLISDSYKIEYRLPQDELLRLIENYINSLAYGSLDGLNRIRAILNGNNFNFLFQALKGTNVKDFLILFEEANEDNKVALLSYMFSMFNRSKLDTIFDNIESQIYNTARMYEFKLTYAKLFSEIEKDSIIQMVKTRYEAIMDTTNERDMNSYDYNFNNSEKWLEKAMDGHLDFLNQEPELDSLEIIHRQEIDEWITNLDWNRMDKNYKAYLENMIQTGEEYNIYFFDPTDPRHTAAELLDYYQHADTTLNSNTGKHNGYFGDDGRRFDTLNNQELIDLLSMYNYQLIADRLVTEADLNSTAQIIHLRKITQLIGDRIITGTFVLDTSQAKEINRLLSFCEQVLAIDTSRAWTEECFSLVFRVWWPFQPMLRSWLTSNNEKLASYSKFYLHKLINETMARELVQLSGEAFDQGNRPLAERYMSPLQSMDSQWALKDNNRMPPRRFVNRTFDDSIRWWEEFILPGMVRIGWRVKK
ncbi:MAG: hypothetical protein IPK88_13260 [Saprospiraceae bacterium]|nr:hypothetical protein [Candidatus Defluviibacterium haderslevense]